MTVPRVDARHLRERVQSIYTAVAEDPAGSFHFETGRILAERLGYPPDDLDRLPAEAVESFAGVGYHFDLAAPIAGETVVDLGSGSGMDVFLAALKVGDDGHVIGVDMTERQLEKAAALARAHDVSQLELRRGFIEELPVADASVDLVISNGVINLSPHKDSVFGEIARVLKPGGRMAVSDIVTEHALAESIRCDAGLWAACIGGAEQRDDYLGLIETAGLRVSSLRTNHAYRFLSPAAQKATARYGVASVTLLAATAPAAYVR